MTTNRAPSLWPLTFGLVAVALVMAQAIRSQGDSAPAAIPAPQPERTMFVEVHAVLSLPSATSTPIPTVEPTPRASLATINTCGTATPGAICVKPDAPTAMPTAYPDCATARDGAWCRWPTVTP